MTDDQTQDTRKPKKSWISFLLKLTFFAAAFLLVIFTVMANMGGSSDDLKHSVEAFFSEATGYRAEIRKFNNLVFFPDIVIDFEGMELYRHGRPEDTIVPVAEIGRMQAKMSFWDVMFSTGKIKQLNLEDVVMRAGAFFPSAIKIETARIFDEGGDKALLEAKGFLDANPFMLQAGMQSYGRTPNKRYRFPQERDLFLSLGDMMAMGHMQTVPHEGFRFDNLRITWQGQDTVTGNVALHNRGYKNFDVSGALKAAEYGSEINPDLNLVLEEARPFVEGTLVLDPLHREDVAEGARLRALRDFLFSLWSPAAANENSEYVNFTWDVSVEAPNVMQAQNRIGAVLADLKYQQDEFYVDYNFKAAESVSGEAAFSLILDAGGVSQDAWLKSATGALRADRPHDLWLDTPLVNFVPEADRIENILQSCEHIEAEFSSGAVSLEPDEPCR